MNIDRDQMVFAIAKNITYRKRLEEERNALHLNMTKVNTDLRKLTFPTAHDLRSPINGWQAGIRFHISPTPLIDK